MSRRRRTSPDVVLLLALLAPWIVRWPTPVAAMPGEDDADLAARIAALEVEVHRLENEARADRAAEIRALVHDVLADADMRACILSREVTAGYDGGFYIADVGGRFSLELSGQIQARWVLNRQDDGPRDDTRSGFEMRRVKVGFSGHVLNRDWTYRIRGNFGPAQGRFNLQSAWLRRIVPCNVGPLMVCSTSSGVCWVVLRTTPPPKGPPLQPQPIP